MWGERGNRLEIGASRSSGFVASGFARIEAVQNCGNPRHFGAAFSLKTLFAGKWSRGCYFAVRFDFSHLPCLGVLFVEVTEVFAAASM